MVVTTVIELFRNVLLSDTKIGKEIVDRSLAHLLYNHNLKTLLGLFRSFVFRRMEDTTFNITYSIARDVANFLSAGTSFAGISDVFSIRKHCSIFTK